MKLYIISTISGFIEIFQSVFIMNFRVISVVHTNYIKSRMSDLLFSVHAH